MTPNERLQRVANRLLTQAPSGVLSQPVVESLQQRPTLARLYKAGVELLAGGHYDEAETMFRALLDLPNVEPWTMVGLAQIATRRCRWRESVDAWLACFGRFPIRSEPWWFLELARAEHHCQLDGDAETHLRQCREWFPEFAPAAASLADLLGSLGRHEECLTAWQAALCEFPEVVEPWWFEGLARAERHCGLSVEAEIHLRQCRERFPAYGPAAATLADLLGTMGRHEESATAWQSAIGEFPQTAQSWWFQGFADSLRHLGRHAQAESVLDARDERFPDSLEKIVRQAEAAADSENWSAALDFWISSVERCKPDLRPEWLDGRALALFRLGRIEEALSSWKDLVSGYPDFIPGRIHLAEAMRELGLWAAARQCYADLIARFPSEVKPDWLAGQARGLLYDRREEAAERAIAELDQRFPHCPHGCNLSIEFCYWTHLGVNVMLPRLEAALRRFPNNRPLLGEYVRALLASGQPEHAERVASHLEELGDGYQALISRWRIVMDQHGEGAVRDIARHSLARGDWGLEAGLAIGDFLLSLASAWAAELAQDLFDRLALKLPGRPALVCAQARTLIALRHDEPALQVIRSIASACETREALELRAWAAFRAGDITSAKDLWRTILTRSYFPALHSPEPALELLTPERESLMHNGVTAFVNIRNEMAHLPEFLRHHRRLGVGRFVVIDNMSTDASVDYLRSQPDVILYRTQDAFQTSGAGMRWINVLQERYGQGQWCLYVDADESLIYPGWESLPLNRLTAYLDSQGAEGVAGFMLDVYPNRLLDQTGKPVPQADYRYYDANYAWIGQVRAPYVQPVGGVRWRFFQVHEILHKVPLIRHGSGYRIGSHNTTPLRFAQISAVLVHYKIRNLALRYRPQAQGAGGNPFMANRTPDLMRRHVRYAARMSSLLNADLPQPNLSETLTDSLALVGRGLMQAPAEFQQWLKGQVT
jgi:tetratricopeptide (TPR) repeat protein